MGLSVCLCTFECLPDFFTIQNVSSFNTPFLRFVHILAQPEQSF